MENSQNISKPARIAAWVITGLLTLFLLMDAVMKVALADVSVKGSVELGWPEDSVRSLGIILLVCTILYAVPQTAVLGAILLTGYLGGAVSIMFSAGIEGHPYIFPIVMGVFVWAGIYLRDASLRTLIPIKK